MHQIRRSYRRGNTPVARVPTLAGLLFIRYSNLFLEVDREEKKPNAHPRAGHFLWAGSMLFPHQPDDGPFKMATGMGYGRKLWLTSGTPTTIAFLASPENKNANK